MLDRSTFTLFLVSLLLPLFTSPISLSYATGIYGSSTTLFRAYKETSFEDEEEHTFLPAYQYLSLSIAGGGLEDLSFHASGWGRLHTMDYPEDDMGAGDLSYGYLDWRSDAGSLRLRLGRQLVYMGVVSGQADAITLKVKKYGLSLGVAGGVPTVSEDDDVSGDSLAGLRIGYGIPHSGEIGVSFQNTQENGEPEQRNVGLDFTIDPARYFGLMTHCYYDLLLNQLYEINLIPVFRPMENLRVSLRYNRSMPTSSIGRSSIFSVFSQDYVQDIGAFISFYSGEKWEFQAGYNIFIYDKGDYTYRSGGEIRYYYDDEYENILSAAAHRVDAAENGYTELRIFLKQRLFTGLSLGLDLTDYVYKENINGKGSSVNVGANLTYEAREGVEVVADAEYSRNPYRENEVRGLVKLVYYFGKE